MGHKYGCFACNKLIILYLSPDDFPTHLFIPCYQQSSDLLVKNLLKQLSTLPNVQFRIQLSSGQKRSAWIRIGLRCQRVRWSQKLARPSLYKPISTTFAICSVGLSWRQMASRCLSRLLYSINATRPYRYSCWSSAFSQVIHTIEDLSSFLKRKLRLFGMKIRFSSGFRYLSRSCQLFSLSHVDEETSILIRNDFL